MNFITTKTKDDVTVHFIKESVIRIEEYPTSIIVYFVDGKSEKFNMSFNEFNMLLES